MLNFEKIMSANTFSLMEQEAYSIKVTLECSSKLETSIFLILLKPFLTFA